VHATSKRLVHVLTQISCQYNHPVILFHFLKKISYLNVGITVMGVPHLGAFAKKGISLIKEQDGI